MNVNHTSYLEFFEIIKDQDHPIVIVIGMECSGKSYLINKIYNDFKDCKVTEPSKILIETQSLDLNSVYQKHKITDLLCNIPNVMNYSFTALEYFQFTQSLSLFNFISKNHYFKEIASRMVWLVINNQEISINKKEQFNNICPEEIQKQLVENKNRLMGKAVNIAYMVDGDSWGIFNLSQ